MCIRIPLTSFSYRHIMICGGRLSLGNLLSRATSTRLVCDCDESARCAFLVVCGWFGLVCVLLIDTIASGRLPSPCFAFVFNSFFPSALLFFFFFLVIGCGLVVVAGWAPGRSAHLLVFCLVYCFSCLMSLILLLLLLRRYLHLSSGCMRELQRFWRLAAVRTSAPRARSRIHVVCPYQHIVTYP